MKPIITNFEYLSIDPANEFGFRRRHVLTCGLARLVAEGYMNATPMRLGCTCFDVQVHRSRAYWVRHCKFLVLLTAYESMGDTGNSAKT
jgi:hypothetical protein